MERKFVIHVEYGQPGGERFVRTLEPSSEQSFGYRVGDDITPGCFRMFFGRKTIIVPLANLLLVEMDL